jgi:hypothetical protein
MKATIEGINKKDNRIGLKVGEYWYGAWLSKKDGAPTEFAWMKDLSKGDTIDLEFEMQGDYRNITSAKRLQPVANDRDRSIGRQVCLKVAGEIVAAMVTAGKIGETGVPETLTAIADAGDRWLNGT